jgi:hypothetical protein
MKASLLQETEDEFLLSKEKIECDIILSDKVVTTYTLE